MQSVKTKSASKINYEWGKRKIRSVGYRLHLIYTKCFKNASVDLSAQALSKIINS
jgi:hypothetical protein